MARANPPKHASHRGIDTDDPGRKSAELIRRAHGHRLTTAPLRRRIIRKGFHHHPPFVLQQSGPANGRRRRIPMEVFGA
ncbi:hypothetical protein CY652_09090 [Burkholderia sp. WAC0059]|nr:hypothetical protein CY652_09090 [Burkholderia sp. WAC0059]